MQNPLGKRASILRAAGEVALEFGAGAMSLEAVAARANVSKGGLLYHFKSKDALIAGMIEQMVSGFEAAIDAHIARDIENGAPVMGRFLRAYVLVSTSPDSEFDALVSALLAAIVSNTVLLGAMREADARWQKRAEEDGVDAAKATVIRLAADGCWLSAIFGFEAGFESPARLGGVQGSLLRLISGEVPSVGAPGAGETS